MENTAPAADRQIPPKFPLAEEIPFATFLGKYSGHSCTVVGRGPTEFDYETLAESADPVFFINDAVCLEKHVRSESFFFAHDPQLLVWMNGAIRSTAVLPVDGKIFRQPSGVALNHTGKIVFYHWREQGREELLLMNRGQIAEAKQLYTHTGTIHSVLHFIWFCGFRKVAFIGCDGITGNGKLADRFHTVDGYDPRLVNLSRSSASPTYPAIARAQHLLTTLFGLEAVYLGTPKTM